MKKYLAGLAVAALALSSFATAAVAAPKPGAKTPAKHSMAAMKCPVCGAALSSRKPKAKSAAMNINSRTYYCTACGAHMAKSNAKKIAAMKCPMCGARLSSRKPGKGPSMAMNVNGKTYYCTACGAHMAAMKKASMKKTSAVKKTSAPKCPMCGMTLASHRDKTHTAPVKINGKTYYCCSACGKHTAKPTAKPVAMAALPACCAHGAKVKATRVAAVSAPDCPKCGMKMSLGRTMMKATPMKVEGKTYYCCTICPKH